MDTTLPELELLSSMRRQAIDAAIASEQQYQALVHGCDKHTECEWLVIMEQILLKAKRRWYQGEEVRSAFRKIAATAIAAMDQCGVEDRVLPADPLNELLPPEDKAE